MAVPRSVRVAHTSSIGREVTTLALRSAKVTWASFTSSSDSRKLWTVAAQLLLNFK